MPRKGSSRLRLDFATGQRNCGRNPAAVGYQVFMGVSPYLVQDAMNGIPEVH